MLLALVMVSTYALVCPNDDWEADLDLNAECVAKLNTFSIECSADMITVTLRNTHLYAKIQTNHVDQPTSSAHVGNCSANAVQSINGVYALIVPFDDCGTALTQRNGKLIFENTIAGDIRANEFGEHMTFKVSCSYPDNFNLTTSISIEKLDGNDVRENKVSNFISHFP